MSEIVSKTGGSFTFTRTRIVNTVVVRAATETPENSRMLMPTPVPSSVMLASVQTSGSPVMSHEIPTDDTVGLYTVSHQVVPSTVSNGAPRKSSRSSRVASNGSI